MDYKFKINDFEGPLDLLLHLIKESKMDIFNIEIVSLTNQYLDFISHMKELNLSIASSYLVMASELMYIKSNYLLPRPEKEEDDDEIDAKEELINRLIEYKKYKETTPIFKELEEKRKEHGNAYLPWEKEADDILIKFYNEGKKIKEIAEIMERSRGAIYSRLKKLGIIN